MQAHVELYRESKTVPTDRSKLAYPEMSRNATLLTEIPNAGKWRWRFKKGRNVMADSGQGYSRRIDCLRSCAVVLGGEVLALTDDVDCIQRNFDPNTLDGDVIEVRDLTREDG